MKRFAAAALWFYAAWYAGSTLSAFAGVPDLAGPALGLVAGLFVGLDPTHRIWTHTSKQVRQARQSA